MYDFAHPIEDAVEGVTHSICTLEFEDHRPLYDWVVRELEYPHPPKQIEFAKLYLTNVVTGKRYIKKLVEDGVVDGWDDPRLVSIAALRRRGFTPESIKLFVDLCGVSKSEQFCGLCDAGILYPGRSEAEEVQGDGSSEPDQAGDRQLSGRPDRGAGGA